MSLPGTWQKMGCIIQPKQMTSWWNSHAMAPSAIELPGNILRIFVGCWDTAGISRIGFVDVDADNPLQMLGLSEEPILDIGKDGTFDENGVFPAHVNFIDNQFYLYYTGFQLGAKIRHYNFGGLAKSLDGKNFARVRKAPVLDRADEGLLVRAGQSVWVEDNNFHTVYSAGSEWEYVGNKSRPTYDVFYQHSSDGLHYLPKGKCIVKRDNDVEHGLGRPQLIKFNSHYLVCYTRRLRNMRYHMGCAISKDLNHWQRHDDWLNLPYGSENEFDSEMVYFPSLIQTTKQRLFLFYSGNNFGQGGLGVAELIW